MNKKKTGVMIGILFLLFAATVVFFIKAMKTETHWSFEESDRRIANPDRGFYIQVKSSSPERIRDVSDRVRVILLSFDIEEYIEEDLPESKLEELEIALEMAQKSHVAVIFRAAYGFHGDVTEPEQIELLGRHIRQIADVLNEHQEQILVVQAGMLGAYGEWHSSRYLDGAEEEKKESRLYILRQWEACLDDKVKVAVRRPRFIREAMEEDILLGRLGLHNDALLSTDSDMGTYDDPDMGRKEELLWTGEHLITQINGGEMPEPGMLNDPENADQEFALLHLGYLNLKYNEEIIFKWSEQVWKGMEAKTFLENHLGYRLFLSGIDVRRIYFPEKLSDGGMQMRFHICNTGYAALPDKYRVFLVVKAGGEQVCREITIPELYQISNGQEVEKKVSIEIPETMLNNGEMVVIGLKIAPDEEVVDSRDCVELANWKFPYRNGMNEILTLERKGQILYEVKKS